MLEMKIKKRLFILVYLLSCFFLSVNFFKGGVINNGDYGRVTHSMNITTEPWKPLSEIYPIQTKTDGSFIRELPSSSLGVIGYIIYKSINYFGGAEINTTYIKIFLHLLFFLGLTFLLKESASLFEFIINIGLAIIIISHGFLMNSLYEEAVIVAILPFLIFSLKNIINNEKILPFLFFSSALIVSKAQMFFVFPVILFILFISIKDKFSYKFIFSFIFISILSFSYIFTVNYFYQGVKEANNYNRFYNGIGYSLQDVADWPTNEFYERKIYFYGNKKELQIKSNQYFSKDTQDLAGTGYWPTGSDMRNSINSENIDQSEKDILERKIKEANSKNYVNIILENPKTIYKILENSIKTAFLSDNSIKYIRNPNEVSDIFSKISIFISKDIYKIIFLIYILSLFVFYKNILFVFYASYVVLGFPVFVVLGDGYFEFEKHLAPYIILFIFFYSALYFITIAGKKSLKTINS